jgi:outer membrane protein assembly factor BamB
MSVFTVSGWKFHADLENSGVYYDGGIKPTNTLLWKFKTGSGIESSPTVSDGVVYVGSYDTYIYAINAGTGKEIWKFKTGDSIVSTPAVSAGVVYVGSRDGNIYAIDAGNGEKIWKFETGSSVDSSPAVCDDVVYAGSDDEYVYAIDARTGKEIWRFKTGDMVTSSPAVSSGVVFIGSAEGNDGIVYAIDARTGKEIWRFETGSDVDSSPAVSSGVVYVGSWDGNIYAINDKTGKKIWAFYENGVENGPAVYEGVIYAGGNYKTVTAINASSGGEIWKFNIGDVVSSPAVSDSVVYVGSMDGNVYAIDAKTGKEIWKFEIGDFVPSSPTISDSVVYVGSWDGNVYAIGTGILRTLPDSNHRSSLIKSDKTSVIQGNPFTVTITAEPEEYYLWIEGAEMMSGEPGDQPPMILTGQDGVEQDDPAGPFEIGKYQYEGGLGKSIKQLVPDFWENNGVIYYCRVETDSGGTRTVKFTSSKDTKEGNYTIYLERKGEKEYISDKTAITVNKASSSEDSSRDETPEIWPNATTRVTDEGMIIYRSIEGVESDSCPPQHLCDKPHRILWDAAATAQLIQGDKERALLLSELALQYANNTGAEYSEDRKNLENNIKMLKAGIRTEREVSDLDS